MKYRLVFFLLCSLIRSEAGVLEVPDGDNLNLKIDPTNKKGINIKIDDKEFYIALVPRPPTLEEQFKIPADLIEKAQASSTFGDELSERAKNPDNGPGSLKDLFKANEFSRANKPAKFDGEKFQEKVNSLSRELFELISENDKTENLDGVYSEAKYHEEAVRDFFKKERELWNVDPDAPTQFREMKIKVLQQLFQNLFYDIRNQLNNHNPDFDRLKKFIKTINDYNSNILKNDEPII